MSRPSLQNPQISVGVVTTGYASRQNTEDGPIEIWVDVFLVGAGDATGRRWILAEREFSTEDAAAALVAKLTHDPISAPAQWLTSSPAYGSEAWGIDDERDLACFEADAYNEPRPQW